MAQKAVLKLDVHDQKDKKKAVKIVSGFAGIDSISMNMNDGKLTVVGLFDPVNLVEKLRKVFTTQIESVGPAKEEKDDNKSGRKDQKGYKIVPGDDYYYYYYNQYLNYPPRPVPPTFYHDHHRSVEEDPNGCVIC